MTVKNAPKSKKEKEKKLFSRFNKIKVDFRFVLNKCGFSSIKRNMKLPYYTATKGLEIYPANERFIVYRSAHKQLLKEDAVYRKRCNAYLISITCLAIVPVLGLVANGIEKVLMSAFLLIAVAPMIVFFAFRHQRYMNERIGEALQKAS